MKAARASVSPHWYFVLLAAVVIFFSIIRFRLRDVPLERDEGEYAYAGQLILHGIAPYKLAYNMKLPGTYAAYSLMMAIFGQSPAGIHVGLLLVNAATVLLLFLLAQRLFGPVAGLVAGSSYALLSSSESVLGLAGHATHFVVLAALGGILLLLHAVESRTTRLYFWSGFLLGLAFVLKQPGICFALFGGFYLIVSEWQRAQPRRGVARVLAVYSAGAVAPFALTCFLLFFAGALGKMWFWTFSYGSLYASAMSLSDGWQELVGAFPSVVQSSFLMWILAAAGLAASGWDSGARKHIVFLVGFLLFSWFAVCPGFYFRHHYFILVLPAVCLLIGLAVSSATHELLQRFRSPALAAVPALIFLTAFVISIAQQSEIFFA
jgi:hypothetical protein